MRASEFEGSVKEKTAIARHEKGRATPDLAWFVL